MSITTCPTCANSQSWSWDEAFDKFGFCDGDGLIMTEAVADVLRNAGYCVVTEPWGCHNITISSITRDGAELIPADINAGYDDPRDYLPEEIIAALDAALPEGVEVML